MWLLTMYDADGIVPITRELKTFQQDANEVAYAITSALGECTEIVTPPGECHAIEYFADGTLTFRVEEYI